MSIKQLADFFDKPNRQLFIDIKSIGQKIVTILNGHDIYYCPQVSIEGEKAPLYGMLEQRSRPVAYSSDSGISNYVHYRSTLPMPLQRLVVCKELIHILDPDCFLTKTPTDVTSLVIDVSGPKDLRETESDQARHDRLAITMAVGILFPLSIREQFINAYKNKKISSAILAKKVGIPDRYIDRVMQDKWPDFYKQTLREATTEFA